MQSNYKALGNYIQEVNIRNTELNVDRLLGVSIQKVLMPSIANTIGTDMTNYKILKQNQFAYGPVTSRNGDKISIALLDEYDEAIISQAYTSFEITDTEKLHPEYLMMWFRRPEFDRYARFMSHGSAREVFGWDELCNTMLPIPTPEKQREIVTEYNTVKNRIELNNQLIQKLEETAQAIYKQWFVDYEFPDANGNPYKSSGGKMVYNEELEKEIPEGWEVERIEEFASLKYGKMLDSELFQEKGYPVFSGYGVRGYYREYMYDEPQILVLCRGVSGTGEVRMSPRFSYITNLSIIVEVIKSYVKKMYLYYFLKNADLRSLDSGSAQSMITSGDLYNQFVLVPTSKQQSDFDKYTTSIFLEIEVKEKENSKLYEIRDLLHSKLATIKD